MKKELMIELIDLSQKLAAFNIKLIRENDQISLRDDDDITLLLISIKNSIKQIDEGIQRRELALNHEFLDRS